jgi:CRISPR/Cas system CSM-associated protein Csm2 small subunit
MTNSEPLSFWRENQSRFLAITTLARDILVILATGSSVERLFNTTRDICYYRRGRIKSKTIKELMLYLCTLRFKLEMQESKDLKEFFSSNKI